MQALTDGQWGAVAAVFCAALAASATLVVALLNLHATRNHANGANGKHDELLSRFDQVDERIDRIDSRLSDVETDLTTPRKKAS